MIPEFTAKLVRQRVVSRQVITYTGPRSILPLLKRYFAGADRERNVVVLINSAGQVMGITTTAIGTLTKVDACLRDIFKAVLLSGASSFIIVHNHPSGDSSPSEADRKTYETIKESAMVMLVLFDDSLILGANNSYFSFCEEEWRNYRAEINERRGKIIARAEKRLSSGLGSPRDTCLVVADRLSKVPGMVRGEAISILGTVLNDLQGVVEHPARIRRVVRRRAKNLHVAAARMLADFNAGGFPSIAELEKVLPWSEPKPSPPDFCVELGE